MSKWRSSDLNPGSVLLTSTVKYSIFDRGIKDYAIKISVNKVAKLNSIYSYITLRFWGVGIGKCPYLEINDTCRSLPGNNEGKS